MPLVSFPQFLKTVRDGDVSKRVLCPGEFGAGAKVIYENGRHGGVEVRKATCDHTRSIHQGATNANDKCSSWLLGSKLESIL